VAENGDQDLGRNAVARLDPAQGIAARGHYPPAAADARAVDVGGDVGRERGEAAARWPARLRSVELDHAHARRQPGGHAGDGPLAHPLGAGARLEQLEIGVEAHLLRRELRPGAGSDEDGEGEKQAFQGHRGQCRQAALKGK
jgi:hypothetical protein